MRSVPDGKEGATTPVRPRTAPAGTGAVPLDLNTLLHADPAATRGFWVRSTLGGVPASPVRPLFDHPLAIRAGRPGVGGPEFGGSEQGPAAETAVDREFRDHRSSVPRGPGLEPLHSLERDMTWGVRSIRPLGGHAANPIGPPRPDQGAERVNGVLPAAYPCSERGALALPCSAGWPSSSGRQ